MLPRPLSIDLEFQEEFAPEERFLLAVIKQAVLDYLYPSQIVGLDWESAHRAKARARFWLFEQEKESQRCSLHWILSTLYPDRDADSLVELIRSRIRSIEQHVLPFDELRDAA